MSYPEAGWTNYAAKIRMWINANSSPNLRWDTLDPLLRKWDIGSDVD